MRVYGAAFRCPLVSTVLGRVHTVAARALVHTSQVISSFEKHVSITRLGSRVCLTLGLAVGAGVLDQPTASCTPKKRKAVSRWRRPSPQRQRQTSYQPQWQRCCIRRMPQSESPRPTTGGKRRESTKPTVYEAYGRDSTDSSVCICQSTENTVDGAVCGQPIADFNASLWTHLKLRHPVLWATLKGIGSDGSGSGDPVTASSTTQGALEGSAKLSCVALVSYKKMVEALSAAPPETLTEAIEALEVARARRIQERQRAL